ncbi:MAG TPA: EpsI family protein [Steroidobacteraceae bacterium]|nr:EpsI family protein [Steroidobacteraceae bacterium]
MRFNKVQLVLASIAIVLAAILADALAPRALMARAAGPHDLGAVIPKRFAEWTFDPGIELVTPAPEIPEGNADAQPELFGIYSQVVGRGYRNSSGDIVMLMVAYGPAQDFRLKAHRPELCYLASGFRITDKTDAEVPYRDGTRPIEITRLTAIKGSRLEPVSYWMRVGDAVTRGVIERQLVRLEYGFHGIIPDGALIRTSTIGLSPEASFRLQNQFIRELLAAVPAEDLPFFTGTG